MRLPQEFFIFTSLSLSNIDRLIQFNGAGAGQLVWHSKGATFNKQQQQQHHNCVFN